MKEWNRKLSHYIKKSNRLRLIRLREKKRKNKERLKKQIILKKEQKNKPKNEIDFITKEGESYKEINKRSNLSISKHC